ncbi:MAG: hypothetical protein II263_10010, partial [Lachnospiraceae bacterium]|nr:hypothetical protein [Lachnospiraceae bacterium]
MKKWNFYQACHCKTITTWDKDSLKMTVHAVTPPFVNNPNPNILSLYNPACFLHDDPLIPIFL